MTTSVNTVESEMADTQLLHARAPGKIIISGEHSVVYGADALAVAIAEYTSVNFSPVSQSKTINTLFSGIASGVTYPINKLSKLKHRLDARFEQFSQGELPVQNILNHPNDLVMYALMSLLQQLPSRKTLQHFAPHSGVLRSHSTIPTGAGMGSSASAIAATLVLYEDILDKPMTAAQRFEMVRFCERLQHGKGSAIDAAAVTYGGMVRVTDQQPERVEMTLDENWYWLHTGTPATSTGECVQYVRRHHADDHLRWKAFIDITQALEKALKTLSENSPIHVNANQIATNKHRNEVANLIKENQRLLEQIGVVPQRGKTLVREIEALGGAGKISGAGAVAGDKSGLVLMYLPDVNIHRSINTLNQATDSYIKSWGKVTMDTVGATRIDASIR